MRYYLIVGIWALLCSPASATLQSDTQACEQNLGTQACGQNAQCIFFAFTDEINNEVEAVFATREDTVAEFIQNWDASGQVGDEDDQVGVQLLREYLVGGSCYAVLTAEHCMEFDTPEVCDGYVDHLMVGQKCEWVVAEAGQGHCGLQ